MDDPVAPVLDGGDVAVFVGPAAPELLEGTSLPGDGPTSLELLSGTLLADAGPGPLELAVDDVEWGGARAGPGKLDGGGIPGIPGS